MSWNEMELAKSCTWKGDGSWLQRSFRSKVILTWFLRKNIYTLNLLKDKRTRAALYKKQSTSSFLLVLDRFKYFLSEFSICYTRASDEKFAPNWQTRIATRHMDFWVNITSWRVMVTSWRVMVPLEFLFWNIDRYMRKTTRINYCSLDNGPQI